MKIYRFLCLVLIIVILAGCTNTSHSTAEPASSESTLQSTEVTATEETSPTVTQPTEETIQENESVPTVPASGISEKTDTGSKTSSGTTPSDENPEKETSSPEKPTTQEPPSTEPPETEPPVTPETQPQVPETQPPETLPPETVPIETEPVQTDPPETDLTEPPATEEPEVMEVTYEFKRQVAAYAVQYINQYRGSPCTVLSGMSQVAQYRASQLVWNYSHSTADKRAALAYYEYGRYIDATEFGDDASNSYWEADSAEAICAGFYGTDAQAMGKQIADLIRNSSGHWSYISSSEYSYIGVGVEYREGSQYGWYCCVMVGSVDYG